VDWSDSYVPTIPGTSTIRPHPPRRASPSGTLGSSMADAFTAGACESSRPTARVPRALVLATSGCVATRGARPAFAIARAVSSYCMAPLVAEQERCRRPARYRGQKCRAPRSAPAPSARTKIGRRIPWPSVATPVRSTPRAGPHALTTSEHRPRRQRRRVRGHRLASVPLPHHYVNPLRSVASGALYRPTGDLSGRPERVARVPRLQGICRCSAPRSEQKRR
jgi:hypothetical protein